MNLLDPNLYREMKKNVKKISKAKGEYITAVLSSFYTVWHLLYINK